MTAITIARAFKLAFQSDRLREANAWRAARAKDPAIARLVWRRVQQAKGIALGEVVRSLMGDGTKSEHRISTPI